MKLKELPYLVNDVPEALEGHRSVAKGETLEKVDDDTIFLKAPEAGRR